MNRLDPQDLRDRLYDNRAWSKKPLGQHFLIDASTLEAVVSAAELTVSDTVLEIGPGLGVLTEQLVAGAGNIIAVELDPQMQAVIAADFPTVQLVRGDILEVAETAVAGLKKYKVVANIPYQITTPLIKLFLEGGVSLLPERLVLLLQKEVAERLAAPAGDSDRGYLSVLVQYYAEIEYIKTVPRTSFWPEPTVESAVVRMKTRTNQTFSPQEARLFFRYVKAAYQHPRKQLKNVLAGIRGVEASTIAAQFATLGLPDTARAQELTQAQWESLFSHTV